MIYAIRPALQSLAEVVFNTGRVAPFLHVAIGELAAHGCERYRCVL